MTAPSERIDGLAQRARSDRRAVSVATDPPDTDEAMRYLREGVGQAVWVYVEGRTGGRHVAFDEREFAALTRAMNDWLECYAACHGVRLDAEFTLREAATLLVETRNVADVAQLLTGVPPRSSATTTPETPGST